MLRISARKVDLSIKGLSPLYILGASPSGKATGFDPVMRWFESSRPSQSTPYDAAYH